METQKKINQEEIKKKIIEKYFTPEFVTKGFFKKREELFCYHFDGPGNIKYFPKRDVFQESVWDNTKPWYISSPSSYQIIERGIGAYHRYQLGLNEVWQKCKLLEKRNIVNDFEE